MNENDTNLPAYFGYIGSKSKLCSTLNWLAPPEALTAYAELFAGGVGWFLGKPKARINILNDIDGDVIETHMSVAADPEGVMAELEKLRPCRKTFVRLRDLRGTAEWHAMTPAARAAAFIYLVKCSINGSMRSYSVSTKSTSSFNPHFDLRPYGGKFDGVMFESLHWREFLNRFVFKPQEVTLFVYGDPPYVTADTEKYYRFNFDPVEHILLARALTRVNELNDGAKRNVKVMLSYDDDPDGFIRSLYRKEFGWHIQTIDVRYESEHRANRCRSELVIMNYDPPTGGVEEAVVIHNSSPVTHQGIGATNDARVQGERR